MPGGVSHPIIKECLWIVRNGMNGNHGLVIVQQVLVGKHFYLTMPASMQNG
jgi:hypothetical protein